MCICIGCMMYISISSYFVFMLWLMQMIFRALHEYKIRRDRYIHHTSYTYTHSAQNVKNLFIYIDIDTF
jgi:hypothetical protein